MKKRGRDIVFLDIDGVLTLLGESVDHKYKYGKNVTFRKSAVKRSGVITL